MIIVTLSRVGKAFDEFSPLFTDVSFTLAAGERVALIGANGTGKTTLLRMIAGLDRLDDSRAITTGQVAVGSNVSVGYLAQDADADLPEDESLAVAASRVTPQLRQAADEVARLDAAWHGDPENADLHARYAQALGHFEHLGGYDFERRAQEVLLKLGFREEDLLKPVRLLSGGQKTRAALARLLLAEPDLLVLDEPTNHLDLAACEWLQEFLLNYRGTALIVSHDRYFLDRVARKVLVLAHGTTAEFAGNYSQTAARRAALREAQAKQHELQQREIERMEEMVARLRRWAGKGGSLWGQVFSKEKALARLQQQQSAAPAADPRAMKLRVHTQARAGTEVLTLTGVAKTYASEPAAGGGTFALTVPDLLIKRGQRVGLVGPNGSGKTTLLKLIAGLEEPDAGELRLGANVSVAYFRQDFSHLRPELTVLEELVDSTELNAHQARTLLARYLFRGEDVFKPVDVLSGGERCRLALAKLLLHEPNLLLLDEPTNHLDIVSREALEDALREFAGTMLVASHDRYLLDALATRTLEVQNGTAQVFDCGYSEYRELTRTVPAGTVPATTRKTRTPSAASRVQTQRQERALQRKRLSEVEKQIAMLETQLAIVSAVLGNPDTYRNGDARGATQEYTDITSRLNVLHSEWERLVE